MKLYHLTEKSKIINIVREGLVPKLGTNSVLAGRKEPAIYFSDLRSLSYWCILTGSTEVVEVELPNEYQIEDVQHGRFKEYISYSLMDNTGNFSSYEAPKVRPEDMVEACLNELPNYKPLLTSLLRAGKISASLRNKIPHFLEIQKRLNFQVLSFGDYHFCKNTDQLIPMAKKASVIEDFPAARDFGKFVLQAVGRFE